MPTAPIKVPRLAFKEALLHPATPPAAGTLGPAERWCELVATPLFQECARLAYGEYVSGLTPEPAAPGIAAYKAVGAREVLNKMMELGEAIKPHLPSEGAKQLTPV